MDIAEFAGLIGRDEEELKQILLEKKSVRVFSSHFPLSATLEECLKQYIDVPQQNTALKEMREELFADSSRNLLERCIKNEYHILVDTSSIMCRNDAFRKFYKECRPILEQYGRRLEIPYPVMAELGQNSLSRSKDSEAVSRAEKGLELLMEERERGMISIFGDRSDTWTNKRGQKIYFADAGLIVQILAWRNNGESVLFITQDRAMSLDVMKITDVQSVQSSAEILVRKLDGYGSLTEIL